MNATRSSITFVPAEVSSYYAARVPDLKQRRATEWRGTCPVHDGTDDNFAVNAETGQACCHSQCGRGWDILALEQVLTGADFKTARAEVFHLIGRGNSSKESRPKRRIVSAYDYTDERGNLLYQVVRYQPKDFKQRRPDGKGGWTWKKHPHQVLYRLREVLEAPIVFVVEGERDAETLRDHGFVATTNAGGAKAPWLPYYTELLRGREVVLVPDNDTPGRRRVLTIARALTGNVAKLVILTLDEPAIKDITDWFNAGHSERELISMLDGEQVSQ
jgi:DNA primase